MQTVLHIKPRELNSHFLQVIKSLFKDAAELEIIVNAPEKKAAYWKRIDQAIEDVKKGKVISMSMKDLEKYAAKRTRV